MSGRPNTPALQAEHGQYTPPDIHPSVIISRTARVDTTGPLTIRKGVGISHGVVIYTHEHPYRHSMQPVQQIKEIILRPLEIEEGVFVGERAIILSKVARIHRGCLIGAGTVLTKGTTGPFEIWAGNPARKIGMREAANTEKRK